MAQGSSEAGTSSDIEMAQFTNNMGEGPQQFSIRQITRDFLIFIM